ncbi:MAG: YitT family protein [Clostridiales bacterium]|nr:YitT family protein [Clostridiales bacterium]
MKNFLGIAKDYAIIALGAAMLAFGTEMFYSPEHIVTGGFSGVSIIIMSLSEKYLGYTVPLWLSGTVMNAPVFLVCLKYGGKKFTERAAFGTAAYNLFLFLMERLPDIKLDFVIAVIFGGALSGAGLGLVFSKSSSTGGTDLVANIVHKVKRGAPVSRVLFFVDSSIVAAGAFVFGLQKAMYAVVAVFITSKTIDYVMEGLHFSKAVFIISNGAEEISRRVLSDLNRGATSLSGRGAYSGREKNVLLCVVARKQISRLREIVSAADPRAFVIVADVREVLGEGFEHL